MLLEARSTCVAFSRSFLRTFSRRGEGRSRIRRYFLQIEALTLVGVLGFEELQRVAIAGENTVNLSNSDVTRMRKAIFSISHWACLALCRLCCRYGSYMPPSAAR